MADPASAARPEVRAFWNDRAQRYDARFEHRSGDAHALNSRLEATLRLIGPGPGDALDAGMGPGRLCAELAARGWTVFGIDASSEMVALARARLPRAAERLAEGSIEALPFADRSFDRVAATGVLEYASVEAAVSEVARVLRPEGLAVLSYPNPYALYRIWKARLYYPAIRLARRLIGRRGAMLPRCAGAIPQKSFVSLLARSTLELVSAELTSVLPVVAPFDTAFPRMTAALAARLEGHAAARRMLATQVVYLVRRAR